LNHLPRSHAKTFEKQITAFEKKFHFKKRRKVHKNSCGDENWRAMINITIETSYRRKKRESSKLNLKLRENVRDGIVFIS